MSTSSGPSFPTSGINKGHIHYDTSVTPSRAYMYKGGDASDHVNNWTEVDLADGPDIFAKFNLNGKLPTSDIEVDAIGGIVTQDQLSSHVLSSGLISGGTVTDGGSETVNVSACRALVRSTDDSLAALYYVICSATVGLSVPTDTTRYIHLNYNSGNPNVTADTTYNHDVRNRVYLAEVHNIGGVLTIHNDPMMRGDFTYRLHQYIEDLIGNRVSSGESVSETGTRNLIVTPGVIWDRHINKVTTASFDSSGSDTFAAIYSSATPGEFTEVAGQTQWNNTQYDAGGGSLATLTGGTYGVHFIIRGFDGTIGVMYGTAEYATQALAEAAATPTLKPERYDEHGVFIAQLVFLKSAASAASITSIKPIIGSATTSGSGAISLPLAVIQGGTGAITAASARTNLSVSGGTHPFYYNVGTTHILLPHYMLGASSSLTNVNGRTWAIPLYFETAVTISAFIVNCTTLQAGQGGKLALYDTLNCVPNALVLDVGTFDFSSTGIKTIAISQALAKGQYWLAFKTSGNTPVVTGFSAAQMIQTIGANPTSMTSFRTGIQMDTLPYGDAWPATFPAAVFAGTTMPLIGYQRSA